MVFVFTMPRATEQRAFPHLTAWHGDNSPAQNTNGKLGLGECSRSSDFNLGCRKKTF
jgi:hypothetical protein